MSNAGTMNKDVQRLFAFLSLPIMGGENNEKAF